MDDFYPGFSPAFDHRRSPRPRPTTLLDRGEPAPIMGLNAAIAAALQPGARPGAMLPRRPGGDIELEDDFAGPYIVPMGPSLDAGRPAGPLPIPNRSAGFAAGAVEGSGLPEDAQGGGARESALAGLRRAAGGNLGPMLDRYGLSGYGEAGDYRQVPGATTRFGTTQAGRRPTSVTMYGDPGEAEGAYQRQQRDEAVRAGNLEGRLAGLRTSRDSLWREDPQRAAQASYYAGMGARGQSPAVPQPTVRTAGENSAALSDFFRRAGAEAIAKRMGGIADAETYMDPTVRAARHMQQDEGQIAANQRVRESMARGDVSMLDENMSSFVRGETDLWSEEDLLAYADEQGIDPAAALQVLRQMGIQVVPSR